MEFPDKYTEETWVRRRCPRCDRTELMYQTNVACGACMAALSNRRREIERAMARSCRGCFEPTRGLPADGVCASCRHHIARGPG